MPAPMDDEGMDEELDIRFTYHPPKDDQQERYVDLRRLGHEFASLVAALCPASREKSLALTKIDEAVMWANASIARRE